jgi:hypothetical protein
MVGYQELGDVLNGSDAVKAEALRRYEADNSLLPNGTPS